MKHLVIGTAGHVDHGKTVLVEKLTGTNTDRLYQEKERGISIELGFTFLTLNNGKRAGIVDVPGHERFIKNMLAGVGGIDMVIMVIAADEGVMPQTREHMDIIELLQIKKGIAVITKKDLVDESLLELAEEEVQEFLFETSLAGTPVIKVSSVTGCGIEYLKNKLTEISADVPPSPETGISRLPVDRCFSVTGFGTVVTGTLVSGYFNVGDKIEIYPQGIQSRIRSIQVHGENKERAGTGQRVAINLAGIEKKDLKRGNVIAPPNTFKPSNRIDVKFKLLKSSPKPIKNRARIRVYLGTLEILSRILLLDRDEIQPGEECYAQLFLEDKTVSVKNDRFVIRSYSPMQTIGGGKIIEPFAYKHKRFKNDVIQAIKINETGTPQELAEQFLYNKKTMLMQSEIEPIANLNNNEKSEILNNLVIENKITCIQGDNNCYISNSAYKNWTETILSLVKKYHDTYPLREGHPKEEIRSKKFPGLNNKQFDLFLQYMEKENLIITRGEVILIPEFIPIPGKKQEENIIKIKEILLSSGTQPPMWKNICKQLDLPNDQSVELLRYLLRNKILAKISDDIYLHYKVLDEAEEKLINYIREKGQISVSEARDMFNTSRKYTLPLLEYFDTKKITKRTGDVRVAGKVLE
ncbi:MAG: selenocysteine-specific translation elongation factor [Clostridiales bacterium]|nr:selenocysteine-specific translation elongation factor [Clostridiales bacterium]MCF8021907.1 selenocysteine-specific translation elongation factor [Clostridiales bacterium]